MGRGRNPRHPTRLPPHPSADIYTQGEKASGRGQSFFTGKARATEPQQVFSPPARFFRDVL